MSRASIPQPLRVLVVQAQPAALSEARAPSAPPHHALVARLGAVPQLSVQAGDMAAAPGHDVVLLPAAGTADTAAWALHPALPGLAYDHAVVVVVMTLASTATAAPRGAGAQAADAAEAGAAASAAGAPRAADATEAAETLEAAELDLLRLGVEAVLGSDESGDHPAALARALRHAHLRKQLERAARVAYATDLATGLPHQAQLLEHMTQLIALREREAAPLVLIALRIEGVLQATAHLGGEAANVLRRKIAVRLRGGLRASDVVASLGADLFAVMLGRVDMVADGEGVAAKLLRGLEQPFVMAGRSCRVSARVGLATYPAHGKEAQALLQRAVAQASMLATVGEHGVGVSQSGFGVLEGGAAAANDPG